MKHYIGKYVLDTETNSVYHTNGKDLMLEQQVFNVLLYLHQNKHRFIPINELHEQLWQGKIVTDSAVRKTITKLRSKLASSDPKTLYIQSAPKRGYRFVAETSDKPRPIDESHPHEHSKLKKPFLRRKRLWFGLSAVLIFLIILSSISVSKFDNINTLKGYKQTIDIYQSQLLYTNVTMGSKETQILLNNYKAYQTSNILSTRAQIMSLRFINAQRFTFVVRQANICSVYIAPLTEPLVLEQLEPLYKATCSLLNGFSVNRDNGKIYFAYTEEANGEIRLVEIDGNNLPQNRLMTLNVNLSLSELQISPDGNRLLAYTAAENAGQSIIQIDLETGLLLSKYEVGNVSGVVWGDEQSVLYLNDTGVRRIDSKTGAVKWLIDDSFINKIGFSNEHLFFTRRLFDVSVADMDMSQPQVGVINTEVIRVNMIIGDLTTSLKVEQRGVRLRPVPQ